MARTPDKPRNFAIQHKSGKSAADEKTYRDTRFGDVARACHRWLMKNDEEYRKSRGQSTSPSLQ